MGLILHERCHHHKNHCSDKFRFTTYSLCVHSILTLNGSKLFKIDFFYHSLNDIAPWMGSGSSALPPVWSQTPASPRHGTNLGSGTPAPPRTCQSRQASMTSPRMSNWETLLDGPGMTGNSSCPSPGTSITRSSKSEWGAPTTRLLSGSMDRQGKL